MLLVIYDFITLSLSSNRKPLHAVPENWPFLF